MTGNFRLQSGDLSHAIQAGKLKKTEIIIFLQMQRLQPVAIVRYLLSL